MQARVRRTLAAMVALALLVAAMASLLQLPLLQLARTGWRLSRMPSPTALPVPVGGVDARRIADTWGGARSGGRRHEGVDIFAPRGTPVRSTTPGIVVRVRQGGLGGRQVWVYGPGGDRHYYAHLDDWAPGLREWQVVAPGTLLGNVGDSGNARGTPPHLHYGIYAAQGAYNPHPLLRAGAAAR